MAGFEIAHAEAFPLELGRAPRKVRKAYQSSVIPLLKSAPDVADPPKVKHLAGYKNLWRLRVSDEYRLVYRIDPKTRVVTLLMLDHRNKVYERLGANEHGEPGVRIVARAEEILEKEPTVEEVGKAEMALAMEPPKEEPHPDRPLPVPLDAETLASWGVPAEYNAALAEARTEGQLLTLGPVVPEDVIMRVLNALFPPPIEEVLEKPVRLSCEPDRIEAAADGLRSLESFLLYLDDDQKAYVARFQGVAPQGPWLLKGGPGSGKSTVALYCIKELIRDNGARAGSDKAPLNILFTTFTKSLVNASQHLLGMLDICDGRNRIDVINVDKLALQHLPQEQKRLRLEDKDQYLKVELAQRIQSVPEFSFAEQDAAYIKDEIDWVILGQDLKTLEEYLAVERTGRGRALAAKQRTQIWNLFEAYRERLRRAHTTIYSERLQQAAGHVTPTYDYVFIDEAQDLKPVAIRFCIGLCKRPENVFITADTNQSIYGNGLSWSRVASDLKFSGRARILRRNYRTTVETWQGITLLAPDGSSTDRDTLDVETVYRGPFPILVRYTKQENLRLRLNSFLHTALRKERVAAGGAAVLCPTIAILKGIMKMIDRRFNAKEMPSGQVDLGHPGVKVLTMHAAKGLQFPVVAVVGLESGKFPWPVHEGFDENESYAQQQCLFFVACSRAIRRLIVFSHRESPSPLVSRITDDLWDIEELE